MTEMIQKLYLPIVADARRLIETHPTMTSTLDRSISPAVLEYFLIEYSSRAVKITEPVEGWIYRAGERCKDVGLDDLGRSLMMHSKHEAGHHLMLIEDTKKLVKHWNGSRKPKLDATTLLDRAPTKAMNAYIRLHEDVIKGSSPHAQVAIELEIERLSVTWGPKFIEQCKATIGANTIENLSFLVEHVEVDVGHTALNEKLLERLLTLRPDTASTLAEIGTQAILTYIEIFGECMSAARSVHSTEGTMHASPS